MAKSDTTKYYSNIQEAQVAEYLGLQVVVGSGSRCYNPGDIKSERYLCECKTHTKIVNKLIFKKEIWNKINSEAISKFKLPILITDDGSQKLNNTWCLIPYSVIKFRSYIQSIPYEESTDILHNQGRPNYNIDIHKLQELYQRYDICRYYISGIKFDDFDLVLMNIRCLYNALYEE